jgi:hypothetical protein
MLKFTLIQGTTCHRVYGEKFNGGVEVGMQHLSLPYEEAT